MISFGVAYRQVDSPYHEIVISLGVGDHRRPRHHPRRGGDQPILVSTPAIRYSSTVTWLSSDIPERSPIEASRRPRQAQRIAPS